jgi:hypothetical protein
LVAFCFLLLSLSFLPPLSPIAQSFLVGSRRRSRPASSKAHCRSTVLRCPINPSDSSDSEKSNHFCE